MEGNENKSFCILPFVHASTLTSGATQLCCIADSPSKMNLNQNSLQDYWQSEELASVREKMLSGQPVDRCRRCYQEEEKACLSHRQVENKAWRNRLSEHEWKRAVEGELKQPLSLDLRLGHHCNLQCVMCRPQESSSWSRSSKKLLTEIKDKELYNLWVQQSDTDSYQYDWYKKDSFWNEMKNLRPHIKELIIGGGEPLLIKEQFDYIKSCVESGDASHIELLYHTNGTYVSDAMFEYWKSFKKVELYVSLDGVGDYAEYIRYPSHWQEIVRNLHKIDEQPENINLRIHYSLQAFNIHHFPDFLKWVTDQNFKKKRDMDNPSSFVHGALVHNPNYLSIKTLPGSYKKWVRNKWEKQKGTIEEFDKSLFVFLDFMDSEDQSDHLSTTYDYIRSLDKTRRLSSFHVFPELMEHLLSSSSLEIR